MTLPDSNRKRKEEKAQSSPSFQSKDEKDVHQVKKKVDINEKRKSRTIHPSP
jgi:hypothetical protein